MTVHTSDAIRLNKSQIVTGKRKDILKQAGWMEAGNDV